MFLEALDQYGDMRFINLTFGHINTEGAKMIAEVLKNSSNTLQSLTLAIGYIENDDDNEGINVILDAISSLKNLKQLEISFLELNEDACYKLFEIIGNFTDLRQLRLYIGNHEDYDQIKLFNGCEVCRDSIETMKKLEVLDISLMNLPESYMQLFAQSVAYLPELRTLNISGNRLDEKGAEIFTNSFKNTDKLDVLMANSCNMDSQIFTTLCRSLNATSLREGYFSNNHIKEGIKGLPISSMKDLLVLDLSHNDISYSELNSFIESFNNATSVKVINLRGNFEEERDNNVLRNFQCDHLEQWKLKTFSDGRAPALLGAYS
jgi:Ran GTPase-activating protein (RanGAP) involved in mRNA processing and transport